METSDIPLSTLMMAGHHHDAWKPYAIPNASDVQVVLLRLLWCAGDETFMPPSLFV